LPMAYIVAGCGLVALAINFASTRGTKPD
jgi:hypothetical protein